MALVRQVSDHAGIPIFNALASEAHPIAGMSEQLDGIFAPGHRRRLLLQATLLCSMA